MSIALNVILTIDELGQVDVMTQICFIEPSRFSMPEQNPLAKFRVLSDDLCEQFQKQINLIIIFYCLIVLTSW